MKQHLIWLLSLFVPAVLPAQTMERQVIGAGGGWAQTAAGSLHWTAGETAVSAYPTTEGYWYEGFQQGATPSTVSAGHPEQELALKVYPNPAADFLNVESLQPLHVQLWDGAGRSVSDRLLVTGTARIDLSALPAGFYLLRTFDETGRASGIAKVQHIR